MRGVISILIAVIVFGILIFIHELGHYTVAKLCDIKIDEFAIGMGPKLFGIKKGETLYSIRALPFGGYVKMEGEDSDSNDERAFCKKKVWQRFLVVIAGAFMNILLGFILTLCLILPAKQLPNMEVKSFQDGSFSSSTGLKIGDKILKINGNKLKTIRDLNYIFANINNGKAEVVVNRNNEIKTINNVKFPVIEDKENNISYAILDFEIGRTDKTFLGSIKYSFNSVGSDVKTVWASLGGIVKGKYGLKSFAGPVQMTKMMGDVYLIGFKNLISFVILITVNLGVLNLLPLPALDGGRVIFLLIEAVRRKPLKPEWEGYINIVGFALLMLLTVLITYNDIVKLFINH